MNYLVILIFVLAVYGRFAEAIVSCSSEKRDVVMILDASESISVNHFKLAKNFIVKIISLFKTANPDSRIALVVFGDEASLNFNLEKYTKLDDIIAQVMKVSSGKGLTAIGKALKLTQDKVVPIMRKDVNKMVILLTDGSNNVYPSPYAYADSLKKAAVQILTIGIGGDINSNELTKIASPGLDIKVKDVYDLQKQLTNIMHRICIDINPDPKKPCKITKQDLVILLDSSDSISPKDFEIAKLFLRHLLTSFQLGSDRIQVAMVTFSDEIKFNFHFDLNNKNKMLEIINNLKKFGTATAIGLALKETRLKIKPKHRVGVPLNVLLITDGVNNMFPKPVGEADLLKKEGANIITVGIGSGINWNELKAISSNDKVLTVNSYNDLLANMKTILKYIQC